jgi:hypothetical protein
MRRNRNMSDIENVDGIHVVTVRKSELLSAIKKNRDTHRAEFLKAQEGYRDVVIAKLDSALRDARERKAYRTFIQLDAPEDHTVEYDMIIRMLEMSTRDVIHISSSEFNNYVMDNWSWKARASTINSSYSKR